MPAYDPLGCCGPQRAVLTRTTFQGTGGTAAVTVSGRHNAGPAIVDERTRQVATDDLRLLIDQARADHSQLEPMLVLWTLLQPELEGDLATQWGRDLLDLLPGGPVDPIDVADAEALGGA